VVCWHEETTTCEDGGDLRRFSTQPPTFYGGIDWHARTMDLCVLQQDGEMLLHRKRQSAPEPWLQAIAASREELVVWVACLFTWYWLADLGTREGSPFVLGHALDMKAIPGGKATHETIDAQKIAVWLRGGLLPQAYGSPAAMRATRALRRRRRALVRTGAALLTHVQQPNRQDHRPALGKKIASTANRNGVATRLPDPAVHKRGAVDLALLGDEAPLLSDLA